MEREKDSVNNSMDTQERVGIITYMMYQMFPVHNSHKHCPLKEQISWPNCPVFTTWILKHQKISCIKHTSMDEFCYGT